MIVMENVACCLFSMCPWCTWSSVYQDWNDWLISPHESVNTFDFFFFVVHYGENTMKTWNIFHAYFLDNICSERWAHFFIYSCYIQYVLQDPSSLQLSAILCSTQSFTEFPLSPFTSFLHPSKRPTTPPSLLPSPAAAAAAAESPRPSKWLYLCYL